MKTLATVEHQLADLSALMAAAPDMLRHEMMAASWESALKVERDVKGLTNTGATHLLQSSIAAQQPTVLPEGDSVTLVATSLNYSVPVELGTKPHMPPIVALEDWVATVINPPAEEGIDVVNKIATLIALKIAKKGTEGQFMFKRGFDMNEDFIKQRFNTAVANVRDKLSS